MRTFVGRLVVQDVVRRLLTMELFSVIAVLSFIVTAPNSSCAGVILQDTSGGAAQVNAFEPIGQSFTAEDAKVSFAFFYEAFNPSFSNDPMQLSLLAGDGMGGTVLGTFAVSLHSGFNGYFDTDLSSITLTIGQKYTAVLVQPGDSPYWGVEYYGIPAYAGGQEYFRGDAVPNSDMRFRVTPTAAAVPEPSSLALAGLGGIGLIVGAIRRRRATAAYSSVQLP